MAGERREVKVAIVGLGRVGSNFFAKLAGRDNLGIKVVAAAERDENAPGVSVAKSRGVAVFKTARDIVAMGESVDIIFDLTGNPDTRRVLRSELARSGNQHTVLAPEVIAYLLWNLTEEGGEFPGDHRQKGY
ncbi:MAG: hypothetical protein HY890_00440 [Deltaproteobacteria bacterium]|nr:hypothetical protein [Deltaproteobacteria bacterium]